MWPSRIEMMSREPIHDDYNQNPEARTRCSLGPFKFKSGGVLLPVLSLSVLSEAEGSKHSHMACRELSRTATA